MRITSKGQVTIPLEIRERLGLLPNSEVTFEVAGDTVRIRKVKNTQRRGPRGDSTDARKSLDSDEHGRDPGSHERVNPPMAAILVDSNVILDVITEDPRWGSWSADTLERCAEDSILVINPIIYAEVSIGFDRIEDYALPGSFFQRSALSLGSCFSGGQLLPAVPERGWPQAFTTA
jgi:AbrB family looped-hinge helix DNA binding protein